MPLSTTVKLLNLTMFGRAVAGAVAPAYVHSTSGYAGRETRTKIALSPVFVLNLVLCGMLLVALGFYIIETNNVTAHQYRGQILSERLMIAQEANGTLMNQVSGSEGKEAITAFAQSRSMVQTSDALYIFDNGSVALQQ